MQNLSVFVASSDQLNPPQNSTPATNIAKPPAGMPSSQRFFGRRQKRLQVPSRSVFIAWPPRSRCAGDRLLLAGEIVGQRLDLRLRQGLQLLSHLLARIPLARPEVRERLLQVLEMLSGQDAGVVFRVTAAVGVALGAIADVQLFAGRRLHGIEWLLRRDERQR